MDVSALESSINQVKEHGKIEELLNQKEIKVQQLEQQISQLMSRFPLWNGSSEELTDLQVPRLTNTVKKYGKEHKELILNKQQIEEKIVDEKQSIEENEKRMRELESLADIPTEDLLSQLRKHRDEGWLVIRNKLNDHPVDDQALRDFTEGLPLNLAFETSIRKSDDTADLMRRESEKLGEKNKLISDIDVIESKIAGLEKQLSIVQEKLVKWQKDWKSEWTPANIAPLSPDEMEEWLDKYEKIVSAIFDKRQQKKEMIGLREKIEELKAVLRLSLKDFLTILEESTLAELVDKAEIIRKDLVDKENHRKNLQTIIEDLNLKLENASERKKEVLTKIYQWDNSWTKALHGLVLSVEQSPAIVKELLETYDECISRFGELQQIEREMEMINEHIVLFHDKVNRLNFEFRQTTDDEAMDTIVTQVYQTLKKAKQDKINIENLNQNKDQFKEDIERAENGITKANLKLNQLMEQAGCDTIEGLEKVEADFKQKQQYAQKIDQLEEELIEAGNGLTLEELLKEAKKADINLIDYELQELNRKINELDNERSEFEQNHGVVKAEYEKKIKGSNFAAVQAAEEKESVLAKISHLTNKYVNHKLASLLLRKGIEYYREQNQSPIIKRASETFSLLTLNSFDGITIDFDEKDQPVIMGIRNDEKVKISGMSDGSTDQLYLALRIASIEKYVSENEPIPFIVDDILVHFDDERSKEALNVLIDLSEKTQVIFFTHHNRLIELMNEVTAEHVFQQTEISTNRSSTLT